MGKWWLPSSSASTIDGVLTISKMGDAHLDLNGTLEDPARWNLERIPPAPVIHGLTRDQHLITLLNSTPTAFKLSAPGYAVESYLVGRVLVGAFLTSDLQVSRGRIQFSELSRFLHTTGLVQEIDSASHSLTQRYARPENMSVTFSDGTQIKLESAYRSSRTSDQLAIHEQLFLAATVPAPLPFEEFITRYLFPLRQLLSIAYLRSVFPSSQQVFSPLVTTVVGEESHEEPLEVIGAVVHPEDVISKAVESPLFSSTDLPGGFMSVLPAWLELAKAQEPALNIFASLYFAPPKYRDMELLLLLIAAESYHRLSSERQSSGREDAQKWLAVLATAPEEHAAWFADRVSGEVEPSLRKRLLDLARRAGPAGARLSEAIPGYAFTLANWRNRLVHHKPGDPSGQLTGPQMLHGCEVVRLILTACLLRDLGVDPLVISELFTRDARVQFAARFDPWFRHRQP